MKFLLIAQITILAILSQANAATFEIQNQAGGPVWIGIQGNPGKAHLENGGFVLNQGQSKTVNSADDWAGRIWGRSYCDPNSKHCGTGDCGNKIECNGAGGAPPATLAEITLRGDAGKDFYDISLVDGFNLRGSIEPVGGQGDGSPKSCKRAACMEYVNDGCPGDLQVRDGNTVIGCKSSCIAHNSDADCCRGAHSTPQTCPAPAGAQYFKQRCPDAYSYAYDDQTSTFTCKASRYNVIFA